MKLNKNNINTFNNLKEDSPAVVAYLMKGCHWCDEMKPEWNTMKQHMNGDGIIAEVTVINGDKSVVDRMNLDTNHLKQGFPSVCRYTPGKKKGKHFRGERNADNLIKFSKKILNKNVGRRSKGRKRRRRKNKTKKKINKIRKKYKKTRGKKRKSKSFYKRMRKRLGFN